MGGDQFMHLSVFIETLKPEMADEAGYNMAFHIFLDVAGQKNICAELFVQPLEA
jgi:hypothetical protein